MIEYKNKVVCFIDIMGFGDMVKTQYPDHPEKIYSIVSGIRMAIMDWSKTAITKSIDLQITQFSDSIVFSFDPVNHYSMNFSFLKELSVNMINKGVLFRGGITFGKIFHDSEFVFGPAMNEAYRLESKEAKSPRIVIDDIALAIKNDDGKTIRDYSGQFVFRIPDTGYSHIDYIFDVYPYAMDLLAYYKSLKSIIEKGLTSLNPDVVEKYKWMRDEYNNAKAKFQDLQLI